MSCDCFCIPTPKSILDDDEIDVFEQIINDSNDYADIMKAALWARYGLRGIGNCDISYWIDATRLRYYQIKTIYLVKFQAIDEWLSSFSNDTIDMSDSHTEYKTVTEDEDTPDNPIETNKYLTNRNTVTYNGKSYGGLSSETVSRFIDSVSNIEEQFTNEFKLQFYHGV